MPRPVATRPSEVPDQSCRRWHLSEAGAPPKILFDKAFIELAKADIRSRRRPSKICTRSPWFPPRARKSIKLTRSAFLPRPTRRALSTRTQNCLAAFRLGPILAARRRSPCAAFPDCLRWRSRPLSRSSSFAVGVEAAALNRRRPRAQLLALHVVAPSFGPSRAESRAALRRLADDMSQSATQHQPNQSSSPPWPP